MSSRPALGHRSASRHLTRVVSIGWLAGTILVGAAWSQPTWRISVDAFESELSGLHTLYSVSDDGSRVVFASDSTFIPSDHNGVFDIFLRDQPGSTTTRVSVSGSGGEANGLSDFPSISGNGLLVAFQSNASNLVPNDLNGAFDIFVHHLGTRTTVRVSRSSGGEEGFGNSFVPTLSDDGQFVSFASDASNLVANDTNGVRDIFLHDRFSGITTRVSVADFTNFEADGDSLPATLSGNGNRVAFFSLATNLVPGDTNGLPDIFVRDLQFSTTRRINVSSSGAQANGLTGPFFALSSDGHFAVFESAASNLVPNDTNGKSDIFVRDLQTRTTTRVSVDSSGNELAAESFYPSISADGRWIAFLSHAANLTPNDTNGTWDVFVHDRSTLQTRLVSRSSAGDQMQGASAVPYMPPQVTGDGRSVVFGSDAPNLVPGDTNGVTDIFLRDRIALELLGVPAVGNPVQFRVSNAIGEAGLTANVLISCSGTQPGFLLPMGDYRRIYLNLDSCTDVGIAFGSLLQGTVDATGLAQTPTISFPNVSPGITVSAMALLTTPTSFGSITSPITFVTQ